MAGVPVYCPHCGALFASRAFQFNGIVRGLTLRGNRETCPNCGEPADIVDGTFDVTQDALTLISGSTFTKEILEAFTTLVERAVRNEINPEELSREADALDPRLREIVRQIKASQISPLAVLILLILSLKACQFDVNAKVDLNELWIQCTGRGNGVVYTPARVGSGTLKRDLSSWVPKTGEDQRTPPHTPFRAAINEFIDRHAELLRRLAK